MVVYLEGAVHGTESRYSCTPVCMRCVWNFEPKRCHNRTSWRNLNTMHLYLSQLLSIREVHFPFCNLPEVIRFISFCPLYVTSHRWYHSFRGYRFAGNHEVYSLPNRPPSYLYSVAGSCVVDSTSVRAKRLPESYEPHHVSRDIHGV